ALSVGDVQFRQKCDALIRDIMQREEVTVLLVTHSATAAEAICTRGLVLEKGKLVFDGTIGEAIDFYEGPRENASRREDPFLVDV
ncbi:MAG: ABC transporter ATP-binding protein, partial [Coriobacteriia bacterium]|nr:ABC transporter ATP-binding protein [Coriobacteriia bacterium]